MKLATYRQPGADPQDPGSTFAAIVTDAEGQRATQVLPLEGFADVGEVLAVPHRSVMSCSARRWRRRRTFRPGRWTPPTWCRPR